MLFSNTCPLRPDGLAHRPPMMGRRDSLKPLFLANGRRIPAPKAGGAWTRLESRKKPEARKMLVEVAESPPSTARIVCDLFARNHSQGWRLSDESRLIFVTAYLCRSMILRKRYRINPCLPGERETAPSLGVRLVNAGRKREAESETTKPDGGSAWAGDYGQDTR